MDNSSKIDPLGFREYDARWLYPEKINGEGIKSVGKGFGSQIIKKIKNPRVAVGHDYRSYSEEVKKKSFPSNEFCYMKSKKTFNNNVVFLKFMKNK